MKTFMKVLMRPELGTQTEAAVAPQYETGKSLDTRRIQAGKRQIQKEKWDCIIASKGLSLVSHLTEIFDDSR